MIKVGVIGLGNIAQKAYLPVYSELQDRFEWHLISRNAEKLARIQNQFGFQHGSTNQDDLFTAGVDAVFIHTPTSTHYAIIKKFLEKRVNVFVDKPISENLDEVQELYRLAENQGVLLTCGFNRRFVPFHQQLAEIQNKHLVSTTKTRENENQTSEFAIYDLMIHVVDTTQFLMGSKGVHFVDGQIVQKNGDLILARMNLQKGNILGTAMIDMRTQSNGEITQVISQNGVSTVDNLNTLTVQKNGTKSYQQAPDWQANLKTRGFDPLIRSFLDALENQTENPVSPASSILAHELCARLISMGKVIE
jgi:virulence factor